MGKGCENMSKPDIPKWEVISGKLQWSPLDERCKEARITIEYGAEKWSFSGEIYEVSVCG